LQALENPAARTGGKTRRSCAVIDAFAAWLDDARRDF